jgi:hypothetical protein
MCAFARDRQDRNSQPSHAFFARLGAPLLAEGVAYGRFRSTASLVSVPEGMAGRRRARGVSGTHFSLYGQRGQEEKIKKYHSRHTVEHIFVVSIVSIY